MGAMEICNGIRVGILAWYPFVSGRKILCISDDDILCEYLCDKGMEAERLTIRESAAECFLEQNKKAFDYIVVVGMLEQCYEPLQMLIRWKSVLKDDGHLLLGVNNRLGSRYFCGDKDPYTNKLFDSIEGYRNVHDSAPKSMGGRLYSKHEVDTMLLTAGFDKKKNYSIFPNLTDAQFIFAEGYIPNEDVTVRIEPQYYNAGSVFLDEKHLYGELIENSMFYHMANSYLIDCSSDDFLPIQHVTISADRRAEHAFITIINNDGTVLKKALYGEGQKSLRHLQDNLAELKKHGIKTVEVRLHGDCLKMPFVEGKLAVFYLRELLQSDRDKFIQEMDRFRELILQSSEHVNDDADYVILKHGFVDMVPINSFYVEGDFVFIDQEFVKENYPANAIIFRMVAFVYDQDRNREAILDESFFWERYGLSDDLQRWIDMSVQFTDSFKASDNVELSRVQGITPEIISCNQAWMDNGFIDEEKLFTNCFGEPGNKRLYLFGSGKYADKFYAFYKRDYTIDGIVDNAIDKWGTLFHNICIQPPRMLEHIDLRDAKVVICIKDYKPVYWQLRSMGVTDIGLYNANYIYRGLQGMSGGDKFIKDASYKKYHIGYVAGVFDLFHIGHLNLLRRAKEQCDYLVVGVVSDEQVRRNKHKEPFVPFEERLEIVRSCRYVDEANEIPVNYSGTVEAFQKYHFDVQFSGSDYISDWWWLEQKKYLEAHGAELVFFPYTEGTSSTMLQSAISSSVNTEMNKDEAGIK